MPEVFEYCYKNLKRDCRSDLLLKNHPISKKNGSNWSSDVGDIADLKSTNSFSELL